jgi:hypothetical protein
MDMLKSMKDALMCSAQAQMSHLDCVDAKELGEVIDMIKDLEEAIYYCTITEAMHQKDQEGGNNHTTIYYSEPRGNYSRMYYDGGTSYRMYDGGRGNAGISNGGSHPSMHVNGGRDAQNWGEARDPREGVSHQQRKMYMESKQMHHGKAKQLQELEKYMKDLSSDMVEMIEDASAEERQYLGNRLTALASKISKLEQ